MNIIYLSHGGGPLPLLEDPDHQPLVTSLQALAGHLPRPSAIVLISAHWEAQMPSITCGKHPELIYDYSGFPQAAYQIEYPCSGSPALAEKLQCALIQGGFEVNAEAHRGFDHGMYVPLKIMYPAADIPCVQLSLLESLNAEQHLSLGKALRNLEWANLLVIGSGASFHNISAFFAGDPQLNHKNGAFMEFLLDTLGSSAITESERWQRLAHWKQAPYAEYCHPREEHLLPLHVCYGLAGKAYEACAEVTVSGCKSAIFHWQTS